jgi:hypothetical protein
MPTAFILHPAPRAYYEWLGRFVEAFAGVEGLVYDTLQRYSGLTDGFASAIFSGTRGETAISYINRLCEVRDIGKENKGEFDDVFGKLKTINNIINSLFHDG